MTLIVTKSNEKLSSANSFKKQRKDATFVKFRTEKPIQGDREGLKKCRRVTSVPPGVFFVSQKLNQITHENTVAGWVTIVFVFLLKYVTAC